MTKNGEHRTEVPKGFLPVPSHIVAEFAAPKLSKEDVKAEQALLAKFEQGIKKKYQTAIVIGRFQPLHYGHIVLMKQAALLADNIVIGIGSANVSDMDNPWSLSERKKSLELSLEKYPELKSKVRLKNGIVGINDYHNDDLWFGEVKQKLNLDEEQDVVVGHNDWVNRIFEDRDVSVVEPPFYNRGEWMGKLIRGGLREKLMNDRSVH